MKKYITTFLAEIRVNIIEMFSYKFSFFLDIIVMFGLLSLAFISNTGYKFINYYSIDSSLINYEKSMVLLGFINWMLCNTSLTVVCNGLREEMLKGIFSQKMMSVVNYPWLLFGKTFGSIVITCLEIFIVIILTKVIFNTNLLISSVYILILLITFLGMYGVSLCIGAIVLEKKKIGQLLLIIQAIILYLSDVFTISDFPVYFKILPLSLGNHLTRAFITNNFDERQFFFLIFISFIWLFAGIFVFVLAYNRMKKKGRLFY